MNNKYDLLKENIRQCNLSATDKKTLISILSEDNVDLNLFLETFIKICKLTSSLLRLFDLDIGEN